MLRTALVFGVVLVGFAYSFQGPIYALMLYLWIAYFRPEAWVWDPGLVMSLKLSYVAGITALGATLLSPATRWRFDLRVTLLFVFLAHSLLSTLLSTQSDVAWPYWIEFLKAIVIGYLIVVLADDRQKLRLVMLTITLSLGLEAAKQGWVGMLLHPGSINTNEIPHLGDNNGVAVGMMMLVPMASALASMQENKWLRRLLQVVAIGVLYRGLSTYSRGGFLACLAMGLVYVLRSPRRLPTLAGLVVTGLLIVPVLPDAFWQRISTIPTESAAESSDESILGRLHFWHVATLMAEDQPLLGVGHNVFNTIYDRYDDSFGAHGRGRSVHSAWFGMLAELGYTGLVLFTAMLVLAWQGCRKARRAAAVCEGQGDLRLIAFAIESASLAFIVGGSFVPFQYNEMLWHTIALSIALNRLASEALEAHREAAGQPALSRPRRLDVAVAS